jgi:hypothetical protein
MTYLLDCGYPIGPCDLEVTKDTMFTGLFGAVDWAADSYFVLLGPSNVLNLGS